VGVLGKVPVPVRRRLRDLGVEVTDLRPHPLESLSKTANKLVGLQTAGDSPVLLVDNDVCFLDHASSIRGRNVSAAVGNIPRISGAQWAHIERRTGLRPLAVEWVRPLEELESKAAGRAPTINTELYLNAGVVWIRRPVVFESIWAAHIARIAQAFDGHPLSTESVVSSDQAGLATAVAEHGGFDLLPRAYNYTDTCFRLGLAERPKILHLLRLGVHDFGPFSKTLNAWWARRILKPIKLDAKRSGAHQDAVAERDRLLDEAVSVRDRLLRLGADAGLDRFRLQT
jgi:hypothetical protein